MLKNCSNLYSICASIIGLLVLTSMNISLGLDIPTMLGKQEYRFYCASCHGPDGKGNGPVADLLVTKPANLQMISKKYGGVFPHDEIYKIIDGRETIRAHGTSEMPVWGDAYSAVAESMLGGENEPERIIIEQNVNGRILSLIYYLQSIQIR